MAAYQPDGRNRAARRQADEARRLAVGGDWNAAAEVNRQVLENFPRDIDAWNRLGKSLLELDRFEEALEAYQHTLAVEPANGIAQRNVIRLEQLIAAQSAGLPEVPPQPESHIDASVFVEEVGKTYVTDLVNPARSDVLNLTAPADEVELRVEGNQVQVFDQSGNRLGQIEPKIGQRLIALMHEGNKYRAFVVALSGATLRIILREVYRNPETPQRVSFPRQATIAAPRPYLRETRRDRELEPDLLLDAEEEEEEAEEEAEEEIEDVSAEEEESDDDEDYVGEVEHEEEEETGIGG